MKDKTDIPEHLDRLRNLYEGAAGTPAPRTADESREFEEIRRMKALLDARPSPRPDAASVNAVIAAARGETVPRGRRVDRSPAVRQRSVGLRVGAVSAALVALLMIVSIFELDVVDSRQPQRLAPAEADASRSSNSSAAPKAESDSEAAENPPAPEERIASAFRDDDGAEVRRPSVSPQARIAGTPGSAAGLYRTEVGLQQSGNSRTPAPGFADSREDFDPAQAFGLYAADALLQMTDGAPAAEEALSWDQRDEVIEVYQQLQMVRGGVESGWGPPPVPLEMLPSGARSSGLRQAGDRQTP